MHNQVRHTLLRCRAVTLFQPRPCFASDNHAHATPRNTEFFCDLALKKARLQGTDCANIALSEFCLGVSLSKLMGSMIKFISLVAGRGFPGQVQLRHATIMAFATTMGGFMFMRRGRAIYMLANKTVDTVIPTTLHDIAVSIGAPSIRPNQTFVTVVGKYYFAKVARRLTTRSSANGRITMPVPLRVVPAAKSPSTSEGPMSIAIAAIYRTCFEVYSHLRSFRDRLWLEPVAALQRSAGSLILDDKSASYNAGTV